MPSRVGLVGLGRMGKLMCQHLLKARFTVTVFDLLAEPMAVVAALGAYAAKSARQVAQAGDVILVMVTDDTQVRQVVGELLDSAQAGAVIAICSSVHPDTCRELAQASAQRGVGLVDAPLARGVRGAESGMLTAYFGGEDKDIALCRPVFAAFCEHVCPMGPVGAGQITKTCNNLLHWATVVACYESLTLGSRLGISPNKLRPALLAGSGESRTLRELDLIGMYWFRKDLETAFELAHASQTAMPLIEEVNHLIEGIRPQDLRALFKEE